MNPVPEGQGLPQELAQRLRTFRSLLRRLKGTEASALACVALVA